MDLSAPIQLRKILKKKPVIGIGLMSGTSADAIDAAMVELTGNDEIPVHLLAYIEHPIEPSLQKTVREMMNPALSSIPQLCQLNMRLGLAFAEAVDVLIKQCGIDRSHVDFIGSHGQTIYHIPGVDPTRDWKTPSTLQLGDPSVIAAKTGITTAGDFRQADMAVGGVGAPLIPFVDAFLFGKTGQPCLCQNLGGIANCTVIDEQGDILAFDSGPANMVMDLLVQHFHTDQHFDRDGNMARQGRVIRLLLKEALNHPFFQKSPPKATGHEDFGRTFLEWFIGYSPNTSLQDLLATACELTVQSIKGAYEKFVFPLSQPNQVIVSGGGVKNAFLMQRLSECIPSSVWVKSDEVGIPSDAKEAIGFAILGWAALNGIPANIPHCTGAKRAVILGKIAPVMSSRNWID